MLILSRRESERICLGDDIVLTNGRVNGDKVRIGIEAPPNVKILRNELENIRTLPATHPLES
ncbi:MAG: carbon storage regulator, partial [Planctomycetota bacterium]